jgi:type II secretory pathway component PulM
MTALQQRWDAQLEKLQQALERLNARERLIVVFGGIFLLVILIAAALFYMHRAAEQQQNRLNGLKDTMVWMQSHAASMRAADEMQLSNTEKVQRAAQQIGISFTSQQSGEQLLIHASHTQYVSLANFLKQLAEMGLSIEKLELIEQDGVIKLTAALR